MHETVESEPQSTQIPLRRRRVLAAAAWAAPIVVAAATAPLAAASTSVSAGNFANRGTCGVVGLLGPGFVLTASPTAPVPTGTTMVVVGSGVANIGVFSVSGAATATASVLSGTSRLITLTSALAPSASVAFRTTLSISVAFSLNATVTLPQGYTQGAEAKPAGFVSSTLAFCSAT